MRPAAMHGGEDRRSRASAEVSTGFLAQAKGRVLFHGNGATPMTDFFQLAGECVIDPLQPQSDLAEQQPLGIR